MKYVVNIAVVGILLALLLAILVPAVAWSGAQFVTLNVTLLDSETETPIENAHIFMMDEHHYESLRTIEEKGERIYFLESIRGQGYDSTDSEGKASLGKLFGAGGGSGIFGRYGKFHVRGDILIEHSEYDDLRMLVANVLQGKVFKLKESEFEVTLYLTKSKPIQPELSTPLAPSSLITR